MLDDMLSDVQSVVVLLANKSDEIKSSIDNLGIDSSVNCYEDEWGNVFVNVSIPIDSKIEEGEIKNCIENITETQFATPSSIKNSEEKILFFYEKTDFSAECIYHQSSGEEGEMCGDCFDSFYDGKGNFIAVLSDGMGTGNRAAIDGIMASSMFSRLIVSGFSFPCALRLVNSAMLVKSCDESLATLDILKLNLYTGQAVIYKAGATVSLLVRQGKVTEIKKSAMPIGILRQAEFGTVHGGLKNGDMLIMMSDGAADNNIQEIKSYIKDNGFSYDLPEKLCALAKIRAIDKCDDITVAIVKISINEE
jgi:stage II sporulation protein E